jgi:hypothetical protein
MKGLIGHQPGPFLYLQSSHNTCDWAASRLKFCTCWYKMTIKQESEKQEKSKEEEQRKNVPKGSGFLKM